MSTLSLGRYLRELCGGMRGTARKKAVRWRSAWRMRLEELETRLAPSVALSSDPQLLQSYGQLPISFEANVGQTDAQVRYLARGSGYALFLTSTAAVLSLDQSTETTAGTTGAGVAALAAGLLTSPTSSATVTGVTLSMNLVGATGGASASALDQLPGTSNYFIGNDPSQWSTNVPNYAQVEYQDVYPGVNLVYFGNQQQLEYNLGRAQ